MKPKLFSLLFILTSFTSCGQEKLECEKHIELQKKESFEKILLHLNDSRNSFKNSETIYDEIINNKISQINSKYEDQKAKYGQLKNKSDKLNIAVKNLEKTINNLIGLSDEKHFDTYDYRQMSDTTFYQNLLFNSDGKLSSLGIELNKGIKNVYSKGIELIPTYNEALKNYNEAKFNTELEFVNIRGDKVIYMQYLFQNKTVIEILKILQRVKLELKTMQYLYMSSIIQ